MSWHSKKPSRSGRSGSGSNNRSDTSPPETGNSSRNDSNLLSAGNDNDGWNEWKWNPQWQQYWRSRQMPDGNWDYQYQQPDPGDNTPRSPFIGTGDSLATIGEGVVSEPGFTRTPQTLSALHPPSLLPRSGQYPSAVEHDSGYIYNTTSRPIPINRNPGYLQRTQNLQQDVSSSYGTGIPAMSNSSDEPLQRSTRHQTTEEEDDYSDDDTIDASAKEFENLQISQGYRTGGGSSYNQRSMVDDNGIPIRQTNPLQNAQVEDDIYDDDTATANPTQSSYSIRSPAPTSSFSSAYPRSVNSSVPYAPFAPTNTEQPLMAMSPSSEQAPTLESTHIQGIATVAEDSMSPQQAALHGNFRVHPAKDFEFGKVFKILWTEPKGQNTAAKGTEVVPTIWGEQCYTSIRRFVIYNPMRGHCLCLPILTYNRQGTAKAGAKAQDHAIIYTEGKRGEKPKETELEEKLLKKAIRMEPRTQRDQLAATSRLNYAKIYTVEYNVKVSFIGKIAQESIKYFNREFNLIHKPLPQAETEYSDDNLGLEDLGEREPEPQNLDERRDSEPSHSHRGSHRGQPNQGQHKRKKKGGK